MKSPGTTRALALLLIWFVRVCQGEVEATAAKPEYLVGAIKLMIRDGASAQQVEELLKAYGVKEVDKDFRYDANKLIAERSQSMRLWRRSGKSPAPQWLELLVPFGHEQRWVDIFQKNSAIIKTANRVKYDPDLGPSSVDIPVGQHSVQAIPFQFNVFDTNEHIFEKIKQFLEKEFPKPTIIFPQKDFENIVAHRIIHANHLNRQVFNSGWQCVRVDLVIVETGAGAREVHGGIDGTYAPGWTGWGGVPPELNDYEGSLLPDHKSDLQQFTAVLSDKMEKSLR